MPCRPARAARALAVLLAVTVTATVGSASTSAAASPCEPITQRGNALQRLHLAWTKAAYSDGVITPAELVQSGAFADATAKITADLGICLATHILPLEYWPSPATKPVKKPQVKKPGGPKAKVKAKKSAISHTYALAKQARKLGKKGVAAQKSYVGTKSPQAGKTFADWLVSIKDFFDKKDQLKAEYEKYFGDKRPKKPDLSKYEAPAAGFRKAQLLQIPQFAKQLEKLGDFRNVAVRAAVSAEQRDPEIRKQLDLAAGLYKGDYFATFDSLSAKEKGDVATQLSMMVQTGAAKRLVAEMNAAGRAGTTLVYAH